MGPRSRNRNNIRRYQAHGLCIDDDFEHNDFEESIRGLNPSSSSGSSGLSTGAEAGIGVGVAVAVLLIVGVLVGVWFCRRKRARQNIEGARVEGKVEQPGLPQLASGGVGEIPEMESKSHPVELP